VSVAAERGVGCPKDPSSLLYINTQEGDLAIFISLRGELDVAVNAVIQLDTSLSFL
jgi:hypothetical protein